MVGPSEVPSAHDRALAVELLARYAEAIDAGDFAGVGALLAEAELLDEHGNRIAAGAEQIQALYEATTLRHADGTPMTAHVITNTIVDVVSADELELRSRFVVFQGTDTLALQPVVVGRYVDRVARRADGWCFVRRTMVPERWGDVSEHLSFDPRPR
jgi:3-phenylpropionate/cinnamic acid dioxygenase small subunit